MTLAAATLPVVIIATSGAQATKMNHEVRVYGLATDGVATPNTPVPTPTLVPPAPTATPTPPVDGFWGEVTHYGESFNGRTMGCGGTYWGSDPGIAAVAYPSRNLEWVCGTGFTIAGPHGAIAVTRTDSCPGCGRNHIDLSEAGFIAVCGSLSVGRCQVWIEVRK